MGRHLIIDGYNCNKQKLEDLKFIKSLLITLPGRIGMTAISKPHLIDYDAEKEIDSGITGTVILAESHVHIHTFPNRRYLALDIFSCKKFDAKKTAAELKSAFGIKTAKTRIIDRGVEL